jgi:hypothetical protein
MPELIPVDYDPFKATTQPKEPKLVPVDYDPFKQAPQGQKASTDTGILRRIPDIGVSLLRGAIAVPETAVGFADIVTGGRTGKALEEIGYKPKEAREILGEYYSPEQQEANRKVSEAKGFVETVGTALQNPSTILHAALESAPSMIGAGAIGRGLVKTAPKVVGPVTAGGIGEGVVSAGQTAEQIRQGTETGLLGPGQSALAGVSGATTALFGVIGGKLAQRLGIGDIDTLLAGGAKPEVKKNILRRVVESALSEGAFEELPQSAQEQVAQNIALKKPFDEGVANAAAQGMLAGMAMGSLGGVLPGQRVGKEKSSTDVARSMSTVLPPDFFTGVIYDLESGKSTVNDIVSFRDKYADSPSVDQASLKTLDTFLDELRKTKAPASTYDSNVKGTVEGEPIGGLAAGFGEGQTGGNILKGQNLIATNRLDQIANDWKARFPQQEPPVTAIANFTIMRDEIANGRLSVQQAIQLSRGKDEGSMYQAIVSGLMKRQIAGPQDAKSFLSGVGKRGIGAITAILERKKANLSFAKTGIEAENLARVNALLGGIYDRQGKGGVDGQVGRREKLGRAVQGQEGRGEAATAGGVFQAQEGQSEVAGAAIPVGKSPLDAFYAKETRKLETPPLTAMDFIRQALQEGMKVPQLVVDEYVARGGVIPQKITEAGQSKAPEPGELASSPPASTLASRIDKAANEAATSPLNDLPEPTQAQKEAGNYKVGKVRLQGLDISIENPRGSTRQGTSRTGKQWKTTMQDHYGYITGYEGKDKDKIDVFIGENPESDMVFVINQVDPGTGKLDEHKIMMGYETEEEAQTAYQRNYEKGWKGLGSIVPMSMDQFKEWLERGDKKKKAKAPKEKPSVKAPSLYSIILKNGGLSPGAIRSTGIDLKEDVQQAGLFGLMRKDGQSPDALATELEGQGIIPPAPEGMTPDQHLLKLLQDERKGLPATLDKIREEADNEFERAIEEHGRRYPDEPEESTANVAEEADRVAREIIAGIESAQALELVTDNGFISEDDYLANPSKYLEEKAQEEQKQPAAAAQAPAGELFDTSSTFALSGQQPINQKTFQPPEKRGERLIESERQSIDELRDRLSEAPETDKGPIVFRKADLSTPSFKLSYPSKPRYTPEEVDRFIDPIRKTLPNIGEIRAVDSHYFQLLLRYARAAEEPGKIFGAYDPATDTTYIISESIGDPQAARAVLLHEVIGHRGIIGALGKNERKQVYRQIYEAYKDTEIAKRIIKDYDLDLEKEADRNTFSAELIAHMAETGEKPGLWKTIVAMIRHAIRRLGINLMYTDADIKGLIGKSYAYSRRRPERAAQGSEMSFLLGGKNAKGADLSALDTASQMEQEGRTKDAIWKATGWIKGIDGKWRFEIDDSKARLRPDKFTKHRTDKEGTFSFKGNLSDVFSHDSLFENYPRLKSLDVLLMLDPNQKMTSYGEFVPGDEKSWITISGKSIGEIKSTILHEIQHAIQRQESFARGGKVVDLSDHIDDHLNKLELIEDQWNQGWLTADEVKKKTGLTPKQLKTQWQAITDAQAKGDYEVYRRLAGEAEAREVSKRAGMTAEERAANPPSWDGIPEDQLIVTGGGGINAQMSLKKGPGKPTETRPEAKPEGGNPFKDSVVQEPVYHGSQDVFSEFSDIPSNVHAVGKSTIGGSLPPDGSETRKAHWFISDKNQAANYANRSIQSRFLYPGSVLYKAYISLKNPLIIDMRKVALTPDAKQSAVDVQSGKIYQIHDYKEKALKEAKKNGNDGVIFKNGYDWKASEADIYAVLSPSQIRIAAEPLISTKEHPIDLQTNDFSDLPNPSRSPGEGEQKIYFRKEDISSSLSPRITTLLNNITKDTRKLADAPTDTAPPSFGDPERTKTWLRQQWTALYKTITEKTQTGDLGKFAKLVQSPEYWDHPVLSRIVRIFVRDRSELSHELFYDIDNPTEGKPSVSEATRELKKADRKGYNDLMWAIDYGDTQWRRDKRKPLEEQVTTYETFLRSKGLSEKVISVWKLHRAAYDKALDLMTAQMRALIKEMEKKAKGGQLFTDQERTTLEQLQMALASMEEWRGFYAPRMREPGSWVLRASRLRKNRLVTRPFAFDLDSTRNEGRFQIKDKSLFESYITVTPETAGNYGLPSEEGINYVLGKSKKNGQYEVQSIRFKTGAFDERSAAAWWNMNRDAIDAEYESYRDHGSKWAMNRRAETMRAQGWSVSRVEKLERLQEEVYQNIQLVDMAKAIDYAVQNFKAGQQGPEAADMAQAINGEVIELVSNMIKARGYRSTMIHRGTGKEVVKGYIEDPQERFIRYIGSVSGGLSKAKVAQMAMNELLGEYVDGELVGGISEKKEPRAYSTAKEYIKEQLRNTEPIDRAIGIAKSIATFKYLGFNLRSLGVNLTAIVTTAPAAIHQYALGGKGNFFKINTALGKAGKDYASFMAGKALDPATQVVCETIKKEGWDDAQYVRDAQGEIQKTHHQIWSKAMEGAMWMFGKSEQWNRGTTVLAAYRLAREQGKGREEALELAKQASDKAHGIYGKATLPTWAMGNNPAAKIGQMMYVYQKFGHNYLQMLHDLGAKQHNIVALTWALAAPMVLAGGAAAPFKDEIVWIINAILRTLGFTTDAEKAVWSSVRRYMGRTAETVGRHGITGLAGVDISSSLSAGIGVPKGFADLAGAIGGVVEDVGKAGIFLASGQVGRAVEKIAPRAAENVLKAMREFETGAVTEKGHLVRDETGAPLMPTVGQSVARGIGFRSSDQATLTERTAESKRAERIFADMRDNVYRQARAYLVNPNKTASQFDDLRRAVIDYNRKVLESGLPAGEVNLIREKELRDQARRTLRPTKKEMLRLRD